MKCKLVTILIAAVAMTYSASPLVAGLQDSVDICCIDECPGDLRCWTDGSSCSPEAPGYCKPVGAAAMEGWIR
jgi:hypothetical protein